MKCCFKSIAQKYLALSSNADEKKCKSQADKIGITLKEADRTENIEEKCSTSKFCRTFRLLASIGKIIELLCLVIIKVTCANCKTFITMMGNTKLTAYDPSLLPYLIKIAKSVNVK